MGPRAVATRTVCCLAAFALVLAPAGQASAVGPVPIGTGHYATAAVDSAGTGYFAWDHQLTGTEDAVDLCVMPRGASACSHTLELRPGQTAFAPPYVFVPSPGVVWILADTCCGPEQTLLYVSNDAGQTFGTPTKVGALAPSGDAILGPGGAVSLVTDTVTGTTNFQRDATDGSTSGTGTSIGSDEYGGTIGLFNGQPVVAYWDFNAGVPNHVDFTAYRGSGDYNASGSWTPPAPVGPGSNTRIASGPMGLFLMFQNGTPGAEHYYVSRYTGSGFAAPIDISGVANGTVNSFYEDGGGRLHAIWSLSSGAIRYTVSTDGVHWAPVITDATDAAGVYHLKGALAGDGQGWAVWDANSSTGPVKVAPLAYPGATGSGTTSVTVGSDVITLQAPSGCVAPGTITAVLTVRSKRPKGHVVVKVKRVSFAVDGKVKKVVKHAPFKALLTITGLKPKSTHTVSAHALLKSHHGPQRSRTLTVHFTIC